MLKVSCSPGCTSKSNKRSNSEAASHAAAEWSRWRRTIVKNSGPVLKSHSTYGCLEAAVEVPWPLVVTIPEVPVVIGGERPR